jgi:hypothetical protein
MPYQGEKSDTFSKTKAQNADITHLYSARVSLFFVGERKRKKEQDSE